jgi:hypothetical protein
MSLYVGDNLKRIAKRLDQAHVGNLKATLTRAARDSKIEIVDLKKQENITLI